MICRQANIFIDREPDTGELTQRGNQIHRQVFRQEAAATTVRFLQYRRQADKQTGQTDGHIG